MRRRRIVIGVVVFFLLLGVVVVRHKRQVSKDSISTSPSVSVGIQGSTQTTSGGGVDFVLPAGDYEYSFELGGVTRRYLAHVPALYDREKPMPLVLFFHGGAGNMSHSARAYGWKETADQEGFIIVFTNGDSRLPKDKFATWNAGRCCGYARDSKSDDVEYTRLVVKDIESKFSIDSGRVFATGMSNGGMMVHRLVCEAADVFKGVAAVAGTDNTVSCTPTRPVSVLHIHAKDDDHVLFEGGAGPEAFRDLDKVTEFTSVPETLSRSLARNKMESEPVRVFDVPGAYCDLYASMENRAKVKICVTETGGHSWTGSRDIGKSYRPSRAFSANDMVWDFFQNLP